MITYCLGDAAVKRAAFRSAGKAAMAACADNDEVIEALDGGGKRWFAIGGVPFGDMTIAEYVAYQKSLVTKKPVRDAEIAYYARLFGLKRKIATKMKRLSVPEYRLAQFTAKYDLAVREAYLNFDGFAYSKRAAKAVRDLAARLAKYFEVFVSVGDYRFIPYGASVRNYAADGTKTDVVTRSFVGRRASVRALRKAVGGTVLTDEFGIKIKSAAVFEK